MSEEIDDALELQDFLNNLTAIHSFSNGYLGVFWLCAHLDNKGYLDLDSDIYADFDELIDGFIAKSDFIKYDYMHQDLGVLHYIIERRDETRLKIVLNKLLSTKINYGKFYVFEEIPEEVQPTKTKTEINTGLSHGNASILAFANICISQNLLRKEFTEMANNFIGFYSSIFETATNKAIIPNYIIQGEKSSSGKRLAWCYGDLGVLYQLLWTSILVENKSLELKMIDYWLGLAQYKVEDAKIHDACFCHGSAGIAYMFYKVYKKTNRPEFLASSKFWNQEMCTQLEHSKDTFYENEDWHENNGLLLGKTGTDFVAKTLSGEMDSDWDRCFLLS